MPITTKQAKAANKLGYEARKANGFARRNTMTLYNAMVASKAIIENEVKALEANDLKAGKAKQRLRTVTTKLEAHTSRWNHIIEASKIGNSLSEKQMLLERERALRTAAVTRDINTKEILRRRARVMTKAINLKTLVNI
jgi:hypothetical protein